MLGNHFKMKDIGETNFILSVKISISCDGIFLDRSYYVEKVLKKYNYDGCKHMVTLFYSGTHFSSIENENDVINQKEYVSMIGNLYYAADMY